MKWIAQSSQLLSSGASIWYFGGSIQYVILPLFEEKKIHKWAHSFWCFLGQTKGNVTPPSSALHLKSQPPSSGDSLRQISCAAASWHTVRMFQSQHGRPDISFMAVTPRLGQPASPNFSIYILFPTQGTEMLQQSRTSPGLVCCAVDMLGNEGRAIPIICAVNRTEEKEVHFRAVSGRLCRRVSRPPS